MNIDNGRPLLILANLMAKVQPITTLYPFNKLLFKHSRY